MKFAGFLCLFTICLTVSGQVADKANAGYRTESDRNSVAQSLGSADRDQRQKPRELVAAMAIKQGMTIADIGTGVGYMLPFLSEAAGPNGRVIAEDVFPDFLEKARARVAAAKLVT
jgi:ubiquinone/menaquinone biosynthesis C-methylase UbiE